MDDNESYLEKERKIDDDIMAICNSLGKLDDSDGLYMISRDCKASLKDLQRFLMHDTKKHAVRFLLGRMNIIKSDFIPLIIQYCNYEDGDLDMFTIILRLCTNLTSSVLLLFENEEIPTDLEERKVYDQLLNNLHRFKEAFANDEAIWSSLKDHLLHNKGDDEVTFERIIILTRNVLQAPVDSTADMGLHDDRDAHAVLLLSMERSGFLSTLIQLMAESQAGAKYCFHFMEIVYYMLRDQNPETIALAKPSNDRRRSLDPDDPAKKRLAELSEQNRRMRQLDAKFKPARFKASTFVATNIRALGSAQMVIQKPVDQAMQAFDMDRNKTKLRKRKFNQSATTESSLVICDSNTRTNNISYFLHKFCRQFVEKVYNAYMTQIKHNLIQKKAQDNDESYYLWAIQFFSAYNQKSGLDLDNISETVSTSCLHFIQVLINSYQDKIEVEKKKFQSVSKRLHLALRAYREILIIIQSIDKESPFAEKVKAIQKSIFNDLEYSTLVINLFQKFSEQKHSPYFLKDLIITNHIFLKIITQDENKKVEATQFLSRYCNPDIIKCYIAALHDFRTLRRPICCMILKFLNQILEDCQRGVMLFQVSIFHLLMDINDHGIMDCHKGYVEFYIKLIQEFGRLFNKRRWVFQEALFWKTSTDVIDIEMAIEPPPVQPSSPNARPLSPTLEEAINTTTSQLPTETLEELMAELADSDDDSEDDGDDYNKTEKNEDDNELTSVQQIAVDVDGRDPSADTDQSPQLPSFEFESDNHQALVNKDDDDISISSDSDSSNSSLPSVGSAIEGPDNEANSSNSGNGKRAEVGEVLDDELIPSEELNSGDNNGSNVTNPVDESGVTSD